jgi:hypothetical protein
MAGLLGPMVANIKEMVVSVKHWLAAPAAHADACVPSLA